MGDKKMENIQKQVRNPWAALAVGLIVGALFGMIVLGWWLFPVEWVNASPGDLMSDYQTDWVEMASAEYALSGDTALAVSRYDALGENKTDILIKAGVELGAQQPEQFAAYVMAVEPDNVVNIVQGTPIEAAEAEKATGLAAYLPIICGIAVAVLAAVAIFIILRRLSSRQPREVTAETTSETGMVDEVKSAQAPVNPQDTPIAQFTSSYRLGDDLYDDSFSIDSPQGEFMGECGSGISEPIGVGDPKKVTAIEVWLFDKNDIQTITKVLMSAHAFQDDAIRNRLAAKGEPVLAAPGEEIILETQTLQMVARIVDMAYGEGPLPPDSFFDRMVIDLSIWPKNR
jgi:hypothetical protein